MSEDVKAAIAAEAVRIVTGTRRAAYGKPEQNFERIASLWEPYLRLRGILAAGASILPRDIAAMMRLMKEARLIETPDHRDSFVDLVGYSLCGAEVSGVRPAPEPQDAPEPGRMVPRDCGPAPNRPTR